MRVVLLCVPLLVACAKEREPAPTEMEDIVRYMFLNWEDPDALAEAKDNLAEWLIDIAGSDEGAEGFRLNRLEEGDLVGVTWPEERGLDNILGVCGAAISHHPVAVHAETQLLSDQRYLNPTNYEFYDRELVGGDAAAFAEGEGMVRSLNDVQTKSWGVKIPYTLHKDFRWVEDTGPDRTFISRSWIQEPGCSDSGNNCLELSFAIDVWFGDGERTLRMTAGWSEVSSGLSIGDDLLVAGLAGGYQNVFAKTEEFLDTY